MERLGFAADEDEYRRAFLFEGVSWRNQYTRIVHGELTREETRGDGPWEVWRSGARTARARGAARSLRGSAGQPCAWSRPGTTLVTTQRFFPICRARSNPCRSNIATVPVCRNAAATARPSTDSG